MAKKKQEPRSKFSISYIKVTFDKDGKVSNTTVKLTSKAHKKRK